MRTVLFGAGSLVRLAGKAPLDRKKAETGSGGFPPAGQARLARRAAR